MIYASPFIHCKKVTNVLGTVIFNYKLIIIIIINLKVKLLPNLKTHSKTIK